MGKPKKVDVQSNAAVGKSVRENKISKKEKQKEKKLSLFKSM
jgi:hypothetical protein